MLTSVISVSRAITPEPSESEPCANSLANYIIHLSRPISANKWTKFTAFSALLRKIRLSRSTITIINRASTREQSTIRVNPFELVQPGHYSCSHCIIALARKHRTHRGGGGGGGTRLRNIGTVLTHSRGTTLWASSTWDTTRTGQYAKVPSHFRSDHPSVRPVVRPFGRPYTFGKIYEISRTSTLSCASARALARTLSTDR